MQRAKEKQLMATSKKDVYKARAWKCYILYSRWVIAMPLNSATL